jgi:hypothetical protein
MLDDLQPCQRFNVRLVAQLERWVLKLESFAGSSKELLLLSIWTISFSVSDASIQYTATTLMIPISAGRFNASAKGSAPALASLAFSGRTACG